MDSFSAIRALFSLGTSSAIDTSELPYHNEDDGGSYGYYCVVA